MNEYLKIIGAPGEAVISARAPSGGRKFVWVYFAAGMLSGGGDMTPGDARKLAAQLNEAADAVEKENASAPSAQS